ncbi:MAG: LLM class F420-dependent oxidoreductase [Acidimicrobiia bacterium]|nr:LLM class F420-dependent oxidoreductase [Acidimicrobiia bacterium]
MAAPSPFTRPFRFGIQASSATNRTAWTELARKVEDLGYATLTVADHLDDQFATTPALMAAADATTTLRLGALVYANDYHHPVLLAKEAATLDVLSEGRLELGMGAGWLPGDYNGAGIAFDPPGVRIARVAEAVQVVKGLLGDEPCHFEGTHYRVDMNGTPKPVQRPHPPILMGGGGRKMLHLAAREADIIGLNVSMASGSIGESSGPSATAEATAQKVTWIREAAGARFSTLELQVRIHLALITDDIEAAAVMLSPAFGLTPAQGLETPHALAGSVEQIADTCLARRDRFGISYIGLSADALDDFAPVVARLAGQ